MASVASKPTIPAPPFFVRLCDFWFFTRPILMSPVWTIVLLAAAPSAGLTFGELPPLAGRIWSGLLVGFFLSGSVYIFNQIHDIKSDHLNQKLFFLPQRIITPTAAWVQYLLFSSSALVGGWLLGPWSFLVVCLGLSLGVLYSWSPLRLKDRPLGGLIANTIGHGLLICYLGRSLAEAATGPQWGIGLPYAFAVAALYLLTTIPDQTGDAKVGKVTISVRYGTRTTALVATVCILAAGFSGVVFHQWGLAISSGLALPFFVLTIGAASFCGVAIRVSLLSLSFFACLVFWPYVLVLGGLYFSTRWYYRRRFGIIYPRLSGGD